MTHVLHGVNDSDAHTLRYQATAAGSRARSKYCKYSGELTTAVLLDNEGLMLDMIIRDHSSQLSLHNAVQEREALERVTIFCHLP